MRKIMGIIIFIITQLFYHKKNTKGLKFSSQFSKCDYQYMAFDTSVLLAQDKCG